MKTAIRDLLGTRLNELRQTLPKSKLIVRLMWCLCANSCEQFTDGLDLPDDRVVWTIQEHPVNHY